MNRAASSTTRSLGASTRSSIPKADGGTLTTRFEYDDQGRLTTTYHPGGVSTTLTYDRDGRTITRVAPLTNDQLVYDAAGRVARGTVAPPSGGSLALTLAYNGLGALQWAQGITPDLTSEDVLTDALGTRLRTRDVNMIDGVNRSRVNAVDVGSGHLTGVSLGTGLCSDSLAQSFYYSSCHPAWYWYAYGQSYDASGNVTQSWEHENKETSQDVVWALQEDRSYYGADEQLTYFNRMVGWLQAAGQGTGSFKEYRSDAFGRRVLTRTRQLGPCDTLCDSFIERTVYDGDQVLAEIRSSGAMGTSSAALEGEGVVSTGGKGDLRGVVLYAPAGGIDQPVQVQKQTPAWVGGAGGWHSVTPHADWRGEYAYGTYPDGTNCISLGPVCPAWPGYRVSAYAETKAFPPPSHTVWAGSLVRGRRDASGLTYLRNRYYDANTGRFTQQDPIGIAGGANGYGFAGGDPVNYQDPFGRCAQETGDSIRTTVSATFCSETGKLKLYDSTGTLVYETTAGNNTVKPDGDPLKVGSNGPAPWGKWPVGAPISTGTSESYGPFFFPIGAPGDVARSRGIGLHGGRSGPQSKTEGCVRSGNAAITETVIKFNIKPITIGCPTP